MLTQNLWIEKGLINNFFGIIINIIWDPDVNLIQAILFTFLIYFNNYDEPTLLDTEQKVIPIFPI